MEPKSRFFAVFLCVLATLREISSLKKASHANRKDRKGSQSQISKPLNLSQYLPLLLFDVFLWVFCG